VWLACNTAGAGMLAVTVLAGHPFMAGGSVLVAFAGWSFGVETWRRESR
jgi:hypothetical protein